MQAKPTMTNIDDLRLFDSCVTLGYFAGECIRDASQLLAIMDHYKILEALVHEYHARFIYPLENGNQRVLDMIRGQTRLHPVWVLEPPRKPGLKAAGSIVDNMLSAGVRAARLRFHSKGALPWLWDDLLSVLEEHCVPCFFDFGEIASTQGELSEQDVEAMRAIANSHHRLPMILSHVMGGVGIHPAVLYLMHRVSNLYIDIAGILDYWKTVSFEIGPERVLFATGMPFTDPGILVSNVQYELNLDENAKKMICGDNLRRLIGGVV